MRLIYKCPDCGLVHKRHVPGVPAVIKVPKFVCKECVVVMYVKIEKSNNGKTTLQIR